MYLRSLLFYIGYILSTILWGSFATLVGLCMPLRYRFNFVIPPWTGFVIWWLKITCGITAQIEGQEYLNRANPAILFIKHQSSWDALFFDAVDRTASYGYQERATLDSFFRLGFLGHKTNRY